MPCPLWRHWATGTVEPMSQLGHRYLRASGSSNQDCVFIGRRYLSDVGPGGEDGFERDHWVLVNEATSPTVTTTYAIWSFEDLLTDIWRSKSGDVYVCGAVLAGLYHFADVRDTNRPSNHLVLPQRMIPEGVWGLEEGPLYIWGTRSDREGRRSYHVVVREGDDWSELPPLPNPICAVHGTAPDCLLAVGHGGMIAHWDGSRWTQLGTSSAIVHHAFVAGPNEMYAVDFDGHLHAGDSEEWSAVGTNPNSDGAKAHRLETVAKFRGQLYVGSEADGLMKASSAGVIEVFKPNLPACDMEARENLIITCPNRIGGTTDNERFFSAAKDQLALLTEGKPLPRG